MSERAGNDRRVRVEVLLDVAVPDTEGYETLDRDVIGECVRAAALRGIRTHMPTWTARVAELTSWSVAS